MRFAPKSCARVRAARRTTRGFHPSSTDALARWMDTRRAQGFRNGPLFCTHRGGPISDQYVRNVLHALAAKAEINKRVHPHGLRHSYAVSLERGADGHRDLQAPRTLVHQHHIEVPTNLTNGAAVGGPGEADLPKLDACLSALNFGRCGTPVSSGAHVWRCSFCIRSHVLVRTHQPCMAQPGVVIPGSCGAPACCAIRRAESLSPSNRITARRRADPGQPCIQHRLGEAGTFREEPVPRVHRVRPESAAARSTLAGFR